MSRRYVVPAVIVAITVAMLGATTPGADASSSTGQRVVLRLQRRAVQAPETPERAADGTNACTAPTPDPSGIVKTYAYYHCYTAQDIRAAYGVDAVDNMGAGQTIVLMDSYGSPTAAADLQAFHDAFFPELPDPNFDAVYPNGYQPFMNIGKRGIGLLVQDAHPLIAGRLPILADIPGQRRARRIADHIDEARAGRGKVGTREVP